MTLLRLNNLAFVGGVGTSGFTPLSISGCKLWLDADDATTITESTGAIDQWDDKSGEGNHLTSLTTKRPTYVASSMNGKAVVLFDGVDDYMQRTTFVGGALAQPNMIFIVIKESAEGRAISGDYVYDGGAATGRHLFVLRTATQKDYQVGHAAAAVLASGLTFSEDHQFTILHNGSSSEIWKDSTNLSASGDGGTANLDGFTLGDHYTLTDPSSTGNLGGEIAEVLIYNSSLSTADRGAVESYLQSKWIV